MDTERLLHSLGRPPFLSSEEEATYDALLDHLLCEIRPQDTVACILIRDLAYNQIEIERYRRIKAGLMPSNDPPDRALIQQNEQGDQPKSRAETSSDEDIRAIERAILEGPWDRDRLVTSFSKWIGDYERAEALYSAARQRFSATLWEIDRHYHGLARTIRESLNKVIDGEVVAAQGNEASSQRAIRGKTPSARAASAAASPLPRGRY